MNVITNNFTKSPEEAIKANNNVLSEPINYASESSASTNGGSSSNPQQAAICAKKVQKNGKHQKHMKIII